GDVAAILKARRVREALAEHERDERHGASSEGLWYQAPTGRPWLWFRLHLVWLAVGMPRDFPAGSALDLGRIDRARLLRYSPAHPIQRRQPRACLAEQKEDTMLKITCRFLAPVMLSVVTMLIWVVGAAAVTPISSCQALSVPGVYVLTTNLTAGSDFCLDIEAHSVTIDLNGFEIRGTGASSFAINGAINATVVHNGTITGYQRPIKLGPGSTIDRMILFGNQGLAISVGA